jgi:plastocyanin
MNSSSTGRKKYNRLFLLFILIVIFAYLPISTHAAIVEVQVLDPRSFSPSEIIINVGDTVRWVNASGGNLHDVTADDFSFRSPTSAGFVFEMTFNTPGDILYHCTVHSRPASMGGTAQNGVIHVVAQTVNTDLSIESVDVIGGTQEVGEDFRVKAVLRNNGGEDTGMFSVNFYASTDDDVTTEDRLLGTETISNISAGESETIDESVDLPADLAVGDYFVGVISDLDDTDNSNNGNVDAASIFAFTDFIINTGLNDAWFDPATDGQGYFITAFPDLGVILVAWFTYDTELPPDDAIANLGDAGHRWITAIGPIDGNGSDMDVTIAWGGLFDTPEVDAPVSRRADGTMTIEFNNCNEGTVTYDIESIDAQGDVPIRRVAIDNVSLCDTLLRDLSQPPQ